MAAISVEEIERDLLSYLRKVEAGETLVITRDGKPVAEIKPVESPPEAGFAPTKAGKKKELRPFGLAKGEFVESADFDDPLPEEILRLFEGKGE